MKKYFVVNNQEDEDGCVLYTANAIIDRSKKNVSEGNSSDSKTNKKTVSAKIYYHEEIPFHIPAKRNNGR